MCVYIIVDVKDTWHYRWNCRKKSRFRNLQYRWNQDHEIKKLVGQFSCYLDKRRTYDFDLRHRREQSYTKPDSLSISPCVEKRSKFWKRQDINNEAERINQMENSVSRKGIIKAALRLWFKSNQKIVGEVFETGLARDFKIWSSSKG